MVTPLELSTTMGMTRMMDLVEIILVDNYNEWAAANSDNKGNKQ